MATTQTRAPVAVDYPDSDGKPMAENDWQRAAIIYAIGALESWFEEQPDVYVSGDLLIYYEEGRPRASVAPDAFVVLGAAKHKRRSYKLWEEPKAPDFVLEVASPNTWRDDVGPKRRLYERLGVREYWLHDPTGEYLGQRLQGLRLTAGGYERQEAARLADGTLTLESEVLGLEAWAQPGRPLRFRDPATGRDLPSQSEERAARLAAEARAEQEGARAEREAAARRAAEARLAELQALIRERGG